MSNLSIPLLKYYDEVIRMLSETNCDGWLAYDFRRTNPLACKALGISDSQMLTRRFFYWVPVHGQPVKIVHGIESAVLDHLPGKRIVYRTNQEIEKSLESILKGKKRVAMEYSPRNENPYISKVDGGVIDLVRSFGADVASSGDLVQKMTSVLSIEQIKAQQIAAAAAGDMMRVCWKWLAERIKENLPTTEWTVQKFLLDQIQNHGFVTDAPPLCAVNAHSADPHYVPQQESADVIFLGDFVLIDLGFKLPGDNGVYADITQVAVVAESPSAWQQEVFDCVKSARDAACTLVCERFEQEIPLRGSEVDRAARAVIEEKGYGSYFIHRTGHNIGFHEHGDGAHLDSYETEDNRLILKGSCFSIEPGIYLPGDFGVRLEHDVIVHHDGQVEMTGDPQSQIICLL